VLTRAHVERRAHRRLRRVERDEVAAGREAQLGERRGPERALADGHDAALALVERGEAHLRAVGGAHRDGAAARGRVRERAVVVLAHELLEEDAIELVAALVRALHLVVVERGEAAARGGVAGLLVERLLVRRDRGVERAHAERVEHRDAILGVPQLALRPRRVPRHHELARLGEHGEAFGARLELLAIIVGEAIRMADQLAATRAAALLLARAREERVERGGERARGREAIERRERDGLEAQLVELRRDRAIVHARRGVGARGPLDRRWQRRRELRGGTRARGRAARRARRRARTRRCARRARHPAAAARARGSRACRRGARAPRRRRTRGPSRRRAPRRTARAGYSRVSDRSARRRGCARSRSPGRPARSGATGARGCTRPRTAASPARRRSSTASSDGCSTRRIV